MAVDTELRSKREEIVREHMESENRHEFDVTLQTFDHPRYELIGTGDVYDGPEEVAAYFEETRAAFPDQRNELIARSSSSSRTGWSASASTSTPGRSCASSGSPTTRSPFGAGSRRSSTTRSPWARRSCAR